MIEVIAHCFLLSWGNRIQLQICRCITPSLFFFFSITQICPYNMQRFLKTLKIIFLDEKIEYCLIFAQNIDRSYTLEPPQSGGSNEYPQSMF